MKKFLLALCLPLAACATPVNLQPATYANQTTIDEKVGVTAELAYKSWRLAVETGVKSGFIKGSTAAKAAEYDNKLYAALRSVEVAYSGGNATSIKDAVDAFNASLASAYSAIGGK